MSKNERMIFYIAGAIVVIALMDAFFLRPIQKKNAFLQNRIVEEKAAIRKNLLILNYKDKIVREYEALKKYFFDPKLSQEQAIAVLLKEIEEVASRTKVNLVNIYPVTVKETKLLTEYTLNLECEGKMENFVEFMYGVENSPKLLKITSFEISPKNRNTYEIKASISIIMVSILP